MRYKFIFLIRFIFTSNKFAKLFIVRLVDNQQNRLFNQIYNNTSSQVHVSLHTE